VRLEAVQRLAHLDGAGRARVLLALQRSAGNAAVQRDIVFHDKQSALTWKDFKGKVDAGSTFSASTFSGHTSLAWKARAKKSGAVWDAVAKIVPASLNLRAFIDRGKSWIRKAKKSAALLAHEQGHFDIQDVLTEKGETAIRAVAAGAEGTASDSKAKKAVAAAVADLRSTAPFTKLASTDAVITQAQHDYDEDPVKGTDHGTKPAEQAQWQADIRAGLPGYPIP
jgi:hypothetical protein